MKINGKDGYLALLKGDKGDPNTLSIGTVEGGESASATITGDSPNQTLNLVLPKGEKGDKGEQGIQGEQGEKGQDGKGCYINGVASNVNFTSDPQEQLDNKAEKDLSNVSYPANTAGSTTTGAGDRVIESYISSDGKTWYRKWASGWKECGFRVIGNSSWQTKILPLTYQNSNYSVTGAGYRLVDEVVTLVVIGIKAKGTSTITIAPMYCYNGTTNLTGADGYIDVCITGY